MGFSETIFTSSPATQCTRRLTTDLQSQAAGMLSRWTMNAGHGRLLLLPAILKGLVRQEKASWHGLGLTELTSLREEAQRSARRKSNLYGMGWTRASLNWHGPKTIRSTSGFTLAFPRQL